MNRRFSLFSAAFLGLASPSIQAVQLGDPRAAVVSEMGEPAAERIEGDTTILSYPRGEISLHESRVSMIELQTTSPGEKRSLSEADIDAIKHRIAELEARLAAAEARAAAAERAAREARSRSSFFGWTPQADDASTHEFTPPSTGRGSRASYRLIPAARDAGTGADTAPFVRLAGRCL